MWPVSMNRWNGYGNPVGKVTLCEDSRSETTAAVKNLPTERDADEVQNLSAQAGGGERRRRILKHTREDGTSIMIAHGKDIKVFAGNASRELAEGICKKLGRPLGDSTSTIFADGEGSVSIGETVRGLDVFVVQSTCRYTWTNGEKEEKRTVNDSLMELLIMIDALKRASAGRVTAVVPYFGYARQDRKTKPRDPISAKLVANLLTRAGADRLLTMDLHANQIQGFFDIPVDNLVGYALFVNYFSRKIQGKEEETVVVSPDVGSVARVRNFAQRLHLPMAIVDKRRQRANQSEVMNIIGNVEGKDIILLDDMVDTGGSLCGAANALVQSGGARSVCACATHGVLSGPALERIESSALSEVIFLDTVPAPKAALASQKIKYISVADIFGEAISRIYNEDSVSALF